MIAELDSLLKEQIQSIKVSGLYKSERVITSPQGSIIRVQDKEVVNFCANNYLGLSNHPDIVEAAQIGLSERGYGMSSVRFICGTQDIHKELEQHISEFLKTEDTVLYSSCFDANGGLFETILNENDVIISDSLNHASIIDGIRLCKAKRKVYAHLNMGELESHLNDSVDSRIRMVATDGVFSMDGELAPLNKICDLAEQYHAIVMVDDSHATGILGENGGGTPEHFNVSNRIDIITSTLGKALGGASGGFTSGSAAVIELLRQRSRPYLFSNSIAPCIAYASITALKLIAQSDDLRIRLKENTQYFRKSIVELGFNIIPGNHPIIPIMLGEASLASSMAQHLLSEGIYVIGFSYPVVPKGQARIRVQISAAHSQEDLNKAIDAFEKVGKQHKII